MRSDFKETTHLLDKDSGMDLLSSLHNQQEGPHAGPSFFELKRSMKHYTWTAHQVKLVSREDTHKRSWDDGYCQVEIQQEDRVPLSLWLKRSDLHVICARLTLDEAGE